MTLRLYLALMSFATLLCWVAWLFVIFYISPTEGGFLGLFFFYLSLFFSIVGTGSVIGFHIRRLVLKDEEIIFRHVRHTFRQSIILATAVIVIFMLTAASLLFWWNFIMLVLFFLFIEFILFTNRRHSNGTI